MSIIVIPRSRLASLAEQVKLQDGYENSFRDKVRASVR